MQKFKHQTTHLLSVLVLTFLSACGILWEHRSLNSFDDMQWKQSDTASFEFKIDEAGTHDVDILVRHVHGFPYAELGILAITKGPGWMDTQMIVIPVIGSEGQYLGDGSGDMFDLQHVLHPALPLNQGAYEIQLIHQMQRDPLPLIMEVGIQVSKPQ